MRPDQENFAGLSLSPELLTVIQELGFEKLTAIQAQSLPPLLEGKDLIGQSKTGSGKTAAFALPILQKIDLSQRSGQALILCPTRELSTQVVRDIRRLGRRLEGLQIVLLSGGQPSRMQSQSLENGVHIAVGTPGRVLDLLQRGRFDLSQLKTLVMDEADKMLDMGFEEEIKAIMERMPEPRQTVFFSATYPESIQALSQRFQKNPVKVTVEDDKESAQNIEQFLFETEPEHKVSTLMRVLQQYPASSTLIFCNQKVTVDELVKLIGAQKGGESIGCAALHGDLEQRDRDRVMSLFRNGSYRILVATDVAARGLDIEHLGLVINFDLPLKPEDHVHRIGRTGRAGRKGIAVTLAKAYDAMKIYEIEKFAGFKFERPQLGFKNQHGLAATYREVAMQTLSISGGRKDKLRPGDILGALTGAAGSMNASDIGKIEIHDRFSYVAIASRLAPAALARLREGRIKGHKFQVKLMTDKPKE